MFESERRASRLTRNRQFAGDSWNGSNVAAVLTQVEKSQ